MGQPPKLVVFDLDACLWHPEMFELSGAPKSWDPATNSVKAGRDRVRLFPGALAALQDLHTNSRFKDTKVAVASSTTEGAWARKCLDLLEVATDVKVSSILSYAEIYCSNKVRHFNSLKQKSGLAYSDMLFFDDCTYGDNCGDVASGCPGVVAVRTPDGMTAEKWAEGLAKFAAAAT